jgi:hypothetical protein
MFRAPGPFIRDPRMLPRFTNDAQYILRSVSGTAIGSDNATFFTSGTAALDRIPGSGVTNNAYSANTYQTVLSYAGMGILSNIVTAIGSASPTMHTLRVTIDGVAYELTGRSTTADTHRVVFGWALPTLATYHGAGSGHYAFGHPAASGDGFTADLSYGSAGGAIYLLGPQDPRIPYNVLFERSILVEAKMSASSSGAANANRSAAIIQAFT